MENMVMWLIILSWVLELFPSRLKNIILWYNKSEYLVSPIHCYKLLNITEDIICSKTTYYVMWVNPFSTRPLMTQSIFYPHDWVLTHVCSTRFQPAHLPPTVYTKNLPWVHFYPYGWANQMKGEWNQRGSWCPRAENSDLLVQRASAKRNIFQLKHHHKGREAWGGGRLWAFMEGEKGSIFVARGCEGVIAFDSNMLWREI